ncbi:MAG: D-alanyl-D-alanine carboxypeptidase family protein [Alphaproteobacteria bacterium]
MTARRLALAGLVFGLIAAPAGAQTFQTKAPFAILIDAESGTVLFENNAHDLMAPASMAKLMLVDYVFNAITGNELLLDDEFPISENAWRRGGAVSGGSTMFAELDSRVRLSDLLRGVIVQSGNDAAIAIAEGLAGSELAFSELLNDHARKIGLRDSTFRNATGLPDPIQRVTAYDLAFLARHITSNYPELYKIFAEPDFTWNDIFQKNRNPLLTRGIGADGLKTGHTLESGYGIVGSAIAGRQRLIVVVNGLENSSQRASEAQKLLEWGFRSFRSVTLFDAGEVVAEGRVYGGSQSRVELRTGDAVNILTHRSSREPLKARVVYKGPVSAPVAADTQVGVIKIWQGDRLIREAPVFTASAVGEGKLHQRALDAVFEIAFGWL